MRASSAWSLARRLRLRLLVVTLVATVITTMAVAWHYGSDVADLRQNRVLELAENMSVRASAGDSLEDAVADINRAEPAFLQHEAAYGWFLIDSRGSLAAVSSAGWRTRAIPVSSQGDEWTNAEPDKETWWAGKRFMRGGESWQIVVAAQGDPAGLMTRMAFNEALIHILLPIGPLALAFAVLALGAVTATVRPLRALAFQAQRARNVAEMSALNADDAPLEVRDLVLALNASLQELAAASARERAFLLDAAHALRTPLAALKARLDLEVSNNEDRAALVTDIDALIRLTRQLLALANSEQLQIGSHQRFDLREAAIEAVSRLEPLAYQSGVEIGLTSETSGPLVLGDRDAIIHALMNLIENAIRHSPPGGQIDVSVQQTPPAIDVRDDGPGMSANQIEQIGKPFLRSSFQDGNGAGLGLSIVKKIMDAHHGHAVFQNRHPQGLSAKLTFTREA